LGGNGNDADGLNYSLCLSGNDNNAVGAAATCVNGISNVAQGNNSVCLGGTTNNANGDQSVAMGFGVNALRNGQMSESSGNVPGQNTRGDSQYSRLTFNGSVSGGLGNAVNLKYDVNITNSEFVLENKTYAMFLEVVSECTADGSYAMWNIPLLVNSDGVSTVNIYFPISSPAPFAPIIFSNSASSASTISFPNAGTTLSFVYTDGGATGNVFITATLRWTEQGNY
jgi:hypothetical protein